MPTFDTSEGKPVPKSKSAIYRDAHGQMWFVGIFTNNYVDSEGDILSKDALTEYAQWVEDRGITPPITIIHQPKFPDSVHVASLIALNAGMLSSEEYNNIYHKLYKPYAIANADKVVDLNGFLLVAGRIHKDKEHIARLLSSTNIDMGMSHGFIQVKNSGKITDKFRSFEFSVLPISVAANKLTVINIKGEMMADVLSKLSDDEREFVESLLDNKEEDIQMSLDTVRGILENLIDSKSEDVDNDNKELPEVYETLRDKVFEDLNVPGLQAVIEQVNTNMHSINLRLNEFESRLKETEVSEDIKIARQLSPSIDWNTIKSVTDEEDIGDTTEEIKAGALESVVQDRAASDNPLNLGLWTPLFSNK